jgi:hypothetical protein
MQPAAKAMPCVDQMPDMDAAAALMLRAMRCSRATCLALQRLLLMMRSCRPPVQVNTKQGNALHMLCMTKC